MLTQARTDVAARVPGPPELLPGCPDAVVDLQTDAGIELVEGQWRYSDAHVESIDFVEVGHPDDPLGPGLEPNRTFDVVPFVFDYRLFGRQLPSVTQSGAVDPSRTMKTWPLVLL